MDNDLTIAMSREEFLALPDVQKFQDALEDSVRTFLGKVDSSWDRVETIYLVLTGGGCDLPMVTRLAGMSLQINGGKTVRLKSTPRVPAFLNDYGEELSKEYPQLAVAMGGRVASCSGRKQTDEGVSGRRTALLEHWRGFRLVASSSTPSMLSVPTGPSSVPRRVP